LTTLEKEKDRKEQLKCEIIDQKKMVFCIFAKPPFLLINNLTVELFFVNTAESERPRKMSGVGLRAMKIREWRT
jgi:hypothetical protein